MLNYSQLLQHPTLGLTNNKLALTIYLWASQIVLAVKNLPPVQETEETWVQSLGQEEPLGEGIATHSSILVWRIP